MAYPAEITPENPTCLVFLPGPKQVTNYIRFLTGMEFYKMTEFKDILEHPLLYPDAKGRHIVLAFFAIQRMRQTSER